MGCSSTDRREDHSEYLSLVMKRERGLFAQFLEGRAMAGAQICLFLQLSKTVCLLDDTLCILRPRL